MDTPHVIIPEDLELSFQYRALVDLLGHTAAIVTTHRLWIDLAHQARHHGRSGVLLADHIHLFLQGLKLCQKNDYDFLTNIRKALLASGFVTLAPDGSGDLFCELFSYYNPHLDRSYVPPQAKWMAEWAQLEKKLATVTKDATTLLPAEAWVLPTGNVILEGTMRRAIILVQTLDIILTRHSRPITKMGIQTLQAAAGVVSQHSEAKLSVVLRRLMAMSRPRLNPLLPHTPEQALTRFDDIIYIASPDEGFEAWCRRIDRDNANVTKPAPDSISHELLEQIDRIQL